jgi:hypothetical protein
MDTVDSACGINQESVVKAFTDALNNIQTHYDDDDLDRCAKQQGIFISQ